MFENVYSKEEFQEVVRPFLHEHRITEHTVGDRNGGVFIQVEMSLMEQQALEDEINAYNRTRTGL